MNNTKLKDFIAEIKGGMARNAHFAVLIKLPAAIANDDLIKGNYQKIMLFCDQAQLPGISFTTAQVRSFGEVKEVPYEKLYEPVSLSFYVDADLTVKRLFDQWVNLIQDTTTRTYQWPSVYRTDTIDIFVYDVENNQRYKCTLHEVYPKAVAPITLDYSNKDLMKLQVQFTYKYCTTDQIGIDTQENSILPINSQITMEQGLMNYGFNLANSIIPSNYFGSFDSFQSMLNNNLAANSIVEDSGVFSGWGIFG